MLLLACASSKPTTTSTASNGATTPVPNCTASIIPTSPEKSVMLNTHARVMSIQRLTGSSGAPGSGLAVW